MIPNVEKPKDSEISARSSLSKTDLSFDPQRYRADFPILQTKVHGKPLIYLDNSATTQKPRQVIDRLRHYYEEENSNVHRGAYYLSQEASEAYENVREKICTLLGTGKTEEIIYTRGTTEAINLVASSWGEANIRKGDTIAVTRMEHHSNFVPWQCLAERKGARFEIIELDSEYRIDLKSFEKVLASRPKILALSMQSNVLGTQNDIYTLATLAKGAGTEIVLVDGAQSVPNQSLSVPSLGPIDFLAFSSHKMCGPTGVGILWGREELLKQMPPIQYGGDMILQVTDKKTTWNELPWKFEAGTPNIAGVIALGAATDYLLDIGLDRIQAYEDKVGTYALEGLKKIDGLKIFGPSDMKSRGTAFSFTLQDIHPHDLATFLDMQGIAVRAGHHCAQPLLQKSDLSGTTRASFYFYNTMEDADALFEGLHSAIRYFKGKEGA